MQTASVARITGSYYWLIYQLFYIFAVLSFTIRKICTLCDSTLKSSSLLQMRSLLIPKILIIIYLYVLRET